MSHRTKSLRPCKADLVTVRHATPRRNLTSIFATGIRPDRARGRLRAVWVHSPARSAWARAHVARRHGVAAADVVVLELQIPRAMLRRHGNGMWFCVEVLSPLRIFGADRIKIFSVA